jgi:hypothetical protein
MTTLTAGTVSSDMAWSRGHDPDDGAVSFGLGADQEARRVLQDEQRDAEPVAQADEADRLEAAFRGQAAGHPHRRVGQHADRDARQAPEPGDDVAGVGRLELEETALVADPADDGLHVVGPAAARRDEPGDLVVVAERDVGVGHRERAARVGRQVGQEPPGRRVRLVG